jgi:SAM-dependent methyltransferase
MMTNRVFYRGKQVAKRIYYYGRRYQCVLCGARTRVRHTISFNLPVLRDRDVVGGEYVENDDCPICYANRRSRLVFLYLKSLQLAPATRVLHIAPELALYEQFFRRDFVRYEALDMDTDQYPGVSGIKRGDITGLSFSDDSFDLVVCNHVLEHVPSDVKAMRELRRVLAPGGLALLQVPIARNLARSDEDPSIVGSDERERRFGQFDHVRIYAHDDYVERLERAGLRVDVVEPASFASSTVLTRYEVNPREKLYVGRPLAGA